MRVPYFLRALILLLVLGFWVGGSILAQTDDCPALVEQAMLEVENACTDVGRNSACYGYNRVGATFFQPQADDYFTQPADRTDLTTLQSLVTAPLDPVTGEWGVALLRVQANVPNTLPGQAVIFVLLGDVSIENAVTPEDAFVPADPVTVTAIIGANIRTGPGANSNVLSSVSAETELQADGLSSDASWVRVTENGIVGWMSRELIDGDISGLPTLTNTELTPMQAFYFTTGVGQSSCVEAPPSTLVVQGPDDLTVNFEANGVGISLSSTVALRYVDGQTIQIGTLHGEAVVGGIHVPAGYTVFASIQVVDGQPQIIQLEGFRPMTQEELEIFSTLEVLPDSLLNYGIEVLETPPIPPTLETNENSGDSTTLVPTANDTDGDSLFDIDEIEDYLTDPNNADTDGDGAGDGYETRSGTNPLVFEDADGDGLSNYREINSYGTDPNYYDTDEDGLNDYQEVITYGTNPTNYDTDGGGLSDGSEISFGYNPFDPGDDFMGF